MMVKICGLRRVVDARLAVALGATHVGAVRAPDSPRRVSVAEAKALFDSAGPGVAKVLVFKGVDITHVVSDARAAGADWVQLYAAPDEDVRLVESEGFRVLRVYPMSVDARNIPRFATPPSQGRPALLDVSGGGSGRRFDWRLLGDAAPDFTFVAGGIRPDNLLSLLPHRPYGIDLSSGVESEPGVKDETKLRALFEHLGGMVEEARR